ncbi:hypothetical protein GC175_01285 [bacterium]|nr:hypothetical protein [bacterium]
MDYEQSVVEFLAQPENLPTALEVARRVEKVRDHLQIRFWHMYRDEMERRQRSSDVASDWRIALTADKDLLKAWARCSIDYISVTKGVLHLAVAVEASKQQWGCPLIYGLRWSQWQQEIPSLPEVTNLRQALKLNNTLAKNSTWWLNYQDSDVGLRRDPFLTRFAAEPNVVIHELSEIVWTFFTQIREPLTALIHALGQPQTAQAPMSAD